MQNDANEAALIQVARENVAARIVQPYNKRAVLAGAWDGGMIMRGEVNRLRAEALEPVG